jgi:hypothetical protein
MLDLRKNQRKPIAGIPASKLTPEQREAKATADALSEKDRLQKQELRTRNKTSSGDNLDRKEGSVFDFLLQQTYHIDFLELLRLNQTLVNPDNTKSKTTLLSQKKFLILVKNFRPDDTKLQETPQSSFYKWLCRNGLGTREQITNYYVSRSKETANKLKRTVIIEELIDDLENRPELIIRLFKIPEFQNQLTLLMPNAR